MIITFGCVYIAISGSLFVIEDISLLQILYITCYLSLCLFDIVAMVFNDLVCDQLICFHVPVVNQYKHKIKPRNKRIRDCQIAPDGQFKVVSTVDRVTGGKHTASGIHGEM